MFDFSEDVVLVTGAAGNLGRAVVKAFLTAGAVVCALDHRQGRMEKIFRSSNKEHRLHLFENVDVTEEGAVLEFAEKVLKEVGKVDILVNTVGGFTFGEMVHELSTETWEKMMSLNVRSFLNVSHAFVPALVEAQKGKVISVGSKSSLKGNAKTGAYAAAKSALLRLTESMALELLPYDIQVNCVLPGIIDTPENRKAMPNADFKKWVAPEEIANVILFLSSPTADAISGAAIPVYGKS